MKEQKFTLLVFLDNKKILLEMKISSNITNLENQLHKLIYSLKLNHDHPSNGGLLYAYKALLFAMLLARRTVCQPYFSIRLPIEGVLLFTFLYRLIRKRVYIFFQTHLFIN